jgi:outer membrane lipoprotein-sorting protein
MKKSLLLALMFCCFAITSLFAAEFKTSLDKIEILKNKGISYNVSSTPGGNKKQTINATIYMKGDKIKIDAAEGITVMDGKNVYIYMEKEKTAMKMNIDIDDVKKTAFDLLKDKGDELKFVEKGTKNGYSCQVFKSKDPNRDIIYYLTDDYGLPTYVKEENSETNITNFKIGNISDSIFVLPKDVNIIDMSNFSMEDLLKTAQ